MRLRAFLLGAALLALFGVVLLRAAKVQLLDRSRLARLQRDQTRRELEWAPRRGMIVDRRGEPLAVTQDVDSVFADPSAFETPRARQVAAARIAGALRLDPAMVLEPGAPDPADLTGATVTLTLDSAIELAAERELARAVKASGAIGGWAVVLDVNTGAVLALAGNPAFDANKPGRDPMVWRDRAVQDQLEPGSTIKSFVVAAALDEGVLPPDELLYCEHGVWRHAGRKIHDTHPVDWATPATILRESSNICAAKIGEKLGRQKLVEGLRAFGFGERTALGLPGEARGALADPRRMPQIALSTTAFGQGMSATAMQTVAAMAAIANGGVLLRPFLVQKVVAADGTTLLSRGREEVRRVLKEDTARELTAMLEEVVEKGTGTRAALLGHRVAGKTGTAQKVDPIRGGYSDKRLASFLGFAPAEAPRIAILVVLDGPEGKGAEVEGGTVTGPGWGAIAHEALRQLDVMPEQVKEPAPLLLSSVASGAADGAAHERAEPPIQPGRARVPDVSGLGARSAMRRL